MMTQDFIQTLEILVRFGIVVDMILLALMVLLVVQNRD